MQHSTTLVYRKEAVSNSYFSKNDHPSTELRGLATLHRILSRLFPLILNKQKSGETGRSRENREESVFSTLAGVKQLPLSQNKYILPKRELDLGIEGPLDSVSLLCNQIGLEQQAMSSIRSYGPSRVVRASKPSGALPSTKVEGSNFRTRGTPEQELIACYEAIEASEELAVRLAVFKTQEEENQCLADLRAKQRPDFKETFKEWLEHCKKQSPISKLRN